MMTPYAYDLAAPLGQSATIGLVVLKSDETLEYEMRNMLPLEGVALYTTRIESAEDVTTDSLASMAPNLESAASLLPSSVSYNSVGYGCTSASSVIGAQAVEEAIKRGVNTNAVTNPMSAAITACEALKVKKLAMLTPYIPEVTAGLRAAIEQAGVSCVALGSFNEAHEAKVARIDPVSIREAAIDLAQNSEAEAIFLSCTNLRTIQIIKSIEDVVDLPVFSSNQALAWHMARQAAITCDVPGRLGSL